MARPPSTPQDDDEGSETTPQPSPYQPPLPHSAHSKQVSEDEGSFASASEEAPPSPYSDPPSSLFSETPPRRVTFDPIRRDDRSEAFSENDDDNDIMERRVQELLSNHRAADIHSTPHSLHSQSVSTTRTVLPAIQQLKQNLLEANQTVYLLREENKALTQECERLEASMLESQHLQQQHLSELEAHWMEQQKQCKLQADADATAFNTRLDALSQENNKLQQQLVQQSKLLQTTQQQLQQQNSSAEDGPEIQRLSNLLKDARRRHQKQSLEAATRMGQMREEMDRLSLSLERMQKVNSELWAEKTERRGDWAQRQQNVKDASCQTRMTSFNKKTVQVSVPAPCLQERVHRIRDAAAERAQIDAHYRHQVDRLTQERDMQLAKLRQAVPPPPPPPRPDGGTQALLSRIQQECDAVFARHKDVKKQDTRGSASPQPASSWSDLDRALDETEAMVRGLLHVEDS